MWAILVLLLIFGSSFTHATSNYSTNDTLQNLESNPNSTRLQTFLVGVDTRQSQQPNVTINTAALIRSISKLDEVIASLMTAKDQDEECKTKTVVAELIDYTTEALLVNINTSLSALGEKLTALQSGMNTPSLTSVLDARSLNLGPVDYRNKGMGVYYESKNNLVVGLPWIFGYVHGLWDGFSVLETVVPMASRGSRVIQVAYAGHEIRIRDEDPGRANGWTGWRSWSS